jgi:hypothetical protein
MAAIRLILILALAAAGCTARPPVHDRSGETHYNRRELPATPGVFTGRTGEWAAKPEGSQPTDGNATEEDCPEREGSRCDPAQRH